jgi:hypothetical protein
MILPANPKCLLERCMSTSITHGKAEYLTNSLRAERLSQMVRLPLGYLSQHAPEWPLNRSQKNAPKGGAVDGTPLEALVMCNYCAWIYLKNAKKKPNSDTSGNRALNGQ